MYLLPVVSVTSVFELEGAELIYRKVTSYNTPAPHDGFFRFLLKGIFGPYVLWPFDKKLTN